jgi:hypothetical protein
MTLDHHDNTAPDGSSASTVQHDAPGFVQATSPQAPVSEAYRVSYGAIPHAGPAGQAQGANASEQPTQPAAPAFPPHTQAYQAPHGYQQHPGAHPPAAGTPVPPLFPPPASSAPQQPPPRHGRTAWLVAGIAAVVIALVGAAAAVIFSVSGADRPAHADSPASAAASQPHTVTVTKTVPAEPTSTSKSRASSSNSSSPSSSSRSSSASDGSTFSSSSSSIPSTAERAVVSRTQIESMLRSHFQNIVDGNYSSAYADLAPTASTAGESSWIKQIREDGLYSFSLSVSPQLTSPTSGVAAIDSFRTEADASGCKLWSGAWSVVRVDGVWKVGKSNLSPTTVSCGD